MSNLDQQIGKRLRKARKLRGYKSARAFAIERNIPESTYSQHETGKRSLNPETVLRYCECLQINPGWLLSATTTTEVSLNASNRRAGYKRSENAPVMMASELVTMDINLFKDVLKKAMQQTVNTNATDSQLDELIARCLQMYNSITRVSSEYQVKEADLVVS